MLGELFKQKPEAFLAACSARLMLALAATARSWNPASISLWLLGSAF